MRSDGQLLPIVPSKRCDSASQKQAQTAQCLGNPLIAEASTTICTRPTFGLLRFSRISTAISAPPLQPTESQFISQN